jgi:flagellar basal body-associated protein FliL
MKNQPQSDKTQGENNEATPVATSRGRFATRPWVIAGLGVWTLVNAAGFAFYRGQSQPAPQEVPSPEVSLGEFKFCADPAEHGPVVTARFALHVSLASQSDRVGRERLTARKFRVQQDVEELLRRAHGADFDDPSLRELKRQIQEQINETLGLRAVADVIITDLLTETPDTTHAAKKPRG